MIGIIFSGHGHFATGLLSAVEVIAGDQEGVVALDFLVSDSSEGLQERMLQKVEEMGAEAVVFMTDIAGGTPFNSGVIVSSKTNCPCRVVSGTNMPAALEAVFSRGAMPIDELITAIENSEQSRVKAYAPKDRSRERRQGGGI